METNNKPDFEKILDQYIYANIGLSLESPDVTPMDKGECKYMLRQMHNDYVIPLQSENQALKSELDKAKEKINVLVEIIANEISKG